MELGKSICDQRRLGRASELGEATVGMSSWLCREPPGSFRDGAPTCATASAAELLLLRVASLPGDTTVQPSTGKQAPADKATPSVPTRSGGSRVRTVRTCYSYPTPDPPREQLHWDLEAGCPGRVLMEAPKTGSLAAWVCLNISSSPGA